MNVKQYKCSEDVLRSAFASKLSYARGNVKPLHLKYIYNRLHSNINKDLEHIWTITDTPGANVYGYKSGDRSYVIAFKGSSSFSDIRTFLDDSIEPFHFREHNVGIHKGVFRLFKGIENSLHSQIMPLVKSSTPLYITFCGHSLGGSIAMVAAGYYSHISHGNIQVKCHTFGAPKVGDDAFLKWLNDDSTLVNLVNHGDIIPCFPICSSYIDVNDTINLGKNDTHSILTPFKQHDLDTYIENIIALYQKRI